jgi:hypothetical protein
VHDPDTIHKVVVVDLPVIGHGAVEPLDGLALPPGFEDIIDDNPTANPLFVPPPMTRFYATIHIDSLVLVPLPPGMLPPDGGDGGDGHPPARRYEWGGTWVDGTVAAHPAAVQACVGQGTVFNRLGVRPSRRRRRQLALVFQPVAVPVAFEAPVVAAQAAGVGANPRPCMRRTRSAPSMARLAELAAFGASDALAMQPVEHAVLAVPEDHVGSQAALSPPMLDVPPNASSDVQSFALLEETTGEQMMSTAAKEAAVLRGHVVHGASQNADCSVGQAPLLGGQLEMVQPSRTDGPLLDRPISPGRSPADQLQVFLSQVGEPVTPGLIRAPPLLPLGAPARNRRRRQPPPPPSRHSSRLANKKKTTSSSVLLEAQRLICKKLGLPADAEEEAAQMRQRFEASFNNPLSPAQIDALTALAEGATLASGGNQVKPLDV